MDQPPTIATVADAMRRGDTCPTCGEPGIRHKGVLQCDARGCPDQGLVIRELRRDERLDEDEARVAAEKAADALAALGDDDAR